MTSRGVHLLFVSTGGVYYRFNSASQVFEMIGRGAARDRIEVATLFNADHVFTRVTERARLVERLAAWAASVPRWCRAPAETNGRDHFSSTIVLTLIAGIE